MISPVINRMTAGKVIAIAIFSAVAPPSKTLAQPYTLECAAVTCGGDTVEQDQIGVMGQAIVGNASNSEYTLDAGIVPCLAAKTTGGVIPAVSEWGLGIMSLVILTAGTLVFRYRASLRFATVDGR